MKYKVIFNVSERPKTIKVESETNHTADIARAALTSFVTHMSSYDTLEASVTGASENIVEQIANGNPIYRGREKELSLKYDYDWDKNVKLLWYDPDLQEIVEEDISADIQEILEELEGLQYSIIQGIYKEKRRKQYIELMKEFGS